MSHAAGVSARGWGWRHAGRLAWAVRGLDLDIQPGERVLLLGASGAGKSTLLAGLAGVLTGQASGEDEGELLVDGQPAALARHRSGLVQQDPDTQLVMSRVGDDVAFGPENYAVPADQIWGRVDAALDSVGFAYPRDRLTAALSGGEKQRLALAGVVAIEPGLLLLDEPTANLDPDGADQVRAAVARVLEHTEATLIVVEHRVEPWLPLVDRVIVLGSGAGLIADGPPERIFAEQGDRLRAGGVWVPGRDLVPPRVRTESLDDPATGRVVLVRAEAAGLTYRGADAPALLPTDLSLPAAQCTAVVGASGSGKSTLAMVLAGLSRPSTGTVTGGDEPGPLHRRRARSLARLVGTVFQDPEHQFVARTVREELLVAPRRLGWDEQRAATRVDELLARLNLGRLAEANPFTLSGGEKRRLSVATALAAAPPLLILDEPTFGQDATTWRELLAILEQARDSGCASLVVSHDRPFVDAVADRVLVMAAGRLSHQPSPVSVVAS